MNDETDSTTGKQASQGEPAIRLSDKVFSPLQLDVGADEQRTSDGFLEELAEDMLHLIEKIDALEQSQSDISARLERVENLIQSSLGPLAGGIEGLRREVSGDRKSLAGRHVFDSVVVMLDSLRTMTAGLDARQDARALVQLNAVASSLGGLLEGIGFEEFGVEPGAPFDPSTMECLGYESGDSGVVISSVRPGYRSGDVVVRPAGVTIAAPRRPTETERPPDCQEEQ